MNARTKLNQAHVNGALLLALVVGWLFQSLSAFVVAALFFAASALYAGDIRPRDKHGPTPHDLAPRPPPNHRRSRPRRD